MCFYRHQELPNESDKIEYLKEITHYLRGKNRKQTRGVFNAAAEVAGLRFRVIAQNIKIPKNIDSNKKGQKLYLEAINAILASLDIFPPEPQSNANEYSRIFDKSDNIYDLLFHLNHDGYFHAGYVLNEIDRANPPNLWRPYLVGTAVLCVGTGIFFGFYPGYFNTVTNWFEYDLPKIAMLVYKFLVESHNLPLLSIVINSGTFIYHMVHAIFYGTRLSNEKLIGLAFRALSAFLTITAQIIIFENAGVMGALPAALFFLNAFVDIAENLYNLYGRKEATNTASANSLSVHQRANIKRKELQKQFVTDELILNLLVATLIIISVAIWLNFSNNEGVSASCQVLSFVIYFLRESIKGPRRSSTADSIQNGVSAIYEQDEIDKTRAAVEQSKFRLDNAKVIFTSHADEKINEHTHFRELLENKKSLLLSNNDFELKEAELAFDSFLEGLLADPPAIPISRFNALHHIFSNNVHEPSSKTQNRLYKGYGNFPPEF